MKLDGNALAWYIDFTKDRGHDWESIKLNFIQRFQDEWRLLSSKSIVPSLTNSKGERFEEVNDESLRLKKTLKKRKRSMKRKGPIMKRTFIRGGYLKKGRYVFTSDEEI